MTHRASEDNVQISFTVPAGFRGPVIIKLAGELDIMSAPAVREHLLSLLRPSLANADAWRDADPRRQFAPALRALAQAHAGTSYAAMTQATQSLLAVLSKEPLTFSPAVAATASRLRGLFLPGPQLAMG